MMKPIPQLNALLAFERAASHLSFTKAAAELNMTQGAISKQIIHLEHRLGVKLFYRKTRALELTEEGVAFRPQVREALQMLEQAISMFDSAPGTKRIAVRIPATLANYWLIPQLQSFRQSHPDTEVRLKTSLGATLADYKTHKDQADIAIVRLRYDERAGVDFFEFLMDDDHVVVCAPQLATKLDYPSDLTGHTLLHSITRKDAWRNWLAAVGETTVDACQGLQLDHYHFVIQAAVAGVGIAIIPYPLVQSFLASQQLVVPFDMAGVSGSAYVLIYDKKKERGLGFRSFKEWLLNMARPVRVPNPGLRTVNGKPLRRLEDHRPRGYLRGGIRSRAPTVLPR